MMLKVASEAEYAGYQMQLEERQLILTTAYSRSNTQKGTQVLDLWLAALTFYDSAIYPVINILQSLHRLYTAMTYV